MTFFNLLFSFHGSISRFEYFKGMLTTAVTFFVLIALPYFLKIDTDYASDSMKLFTAVIYLTAFIFLAVCTLALRSKRLRDLQWNQLLLLVSIIPIASTILGLILLFKPGKTITKIDFQK
jgi:uncharacterized membrane protein YhaH (DUF805 family)